MSSLDKNNDVEKVIINDGMRTWYLDLPFEEQYEFYKALKYFDEQCNKPEHAFQKLLRAGKRNKKKTIGPLEKG